MKLEAKSLLAALNDQKVEYKLFEHEAFSVSYTHLTLPTRS